MKYKAPGKCPVCDAKLHITKLGCPRCQTTIEGTYQPCEFCRMEKEELEFVKVFITCRGNIKDVEKALGISYPTVRSKLDAVIETLGYTLQAPKKTKEEVEAKAKAKAEIIRKLSDGELSATEATEAINAL